MSYAEGYDVFRWPEFQAFAKRLGLDTTLPTTDMCIFIPLEGSVRITQEYLADEMFSMRKDRKEFVDRIIKEQS